MSNVEVVYVVAGVYFAIAIIILLVELWESL